MKMNHEDIIEYLGEPIPEEEVNRICEKLGIKRTEIKESLDLFRSFSENKLEDIDKND